MTKTLHAYAFENHQGSPFLEINADLSFLPESTMIEDDAEFEHFDNSDDSGDLPIFWNEDNDDNPDFVPENSYLIWRTNIHHPDFTIVVERFMDGSHKHTISTFCGSVDAAHEWLMRNYPTQWAEALEQIDEDDFEEWAEAE